MTFPTAYTVQHYVWSANGVDDELGNDLGDWASPVDRAVIGYTEGVTEINTVQGGEGIIVPVRGGEEETHDATVSCPPDWTPNIRDRVMLPSGTLYEVITIRRQDSGFHGWNPGSAVLLKVVGNG